MANNNIGRAIKEQCKDDKNMQEFLMELLAFNLKRRQWYKDEYRKQIEKFAENDSALEVKPNED